MAADEQPAAPTAIGVLEDVLPQLAAIVEVVEALARAALVLSDAPAEAGW